LGVFVLFVSFVWAAAIYKQTQTPDPLVIPPQPQSLISANAPLASSPQSTALTSAQHLAEAKQALAEGYKPNKDMKKASWGEVSAAKWHLKAIGSSAAEYREAQVLLKEVGRREKQIEIATKQAVVSSPVEDDDTAASIEDDDSNDTSSTAVTSPSPSSGTGRSSTSSDKAGRLSSDDHYTNVDGVRVKRPTFSDSGPPSGASAQCRDGSYSFSLNRRGTCSHHGGVAKWL
jgi:hypothetical protein